jgi:transposase-like protein
MTNIYRPSALSEVAAAVARGESIASAARRVGVPASTAHSWLRRSSRPAAGPPPAPTFLELVAPAPTPALVVRVGEAAIEVGVGFDAALLRAIVAALAGGAA